MTQQQAERLVKEIESFIIDGQRLKTEFEDALSVESTEEIRAEIQQRRADLVTAFLEASK